MIKANNYFLQFHKHLIATSPSMRNNLAAFLQSDWCKHVWEVYHENAKNDTLPELFMKDVVFAFKSFSSKTKFNKDAILGFPSAQASAAKIPAKTEPTKASASIMKDRTPRERVLDWAAEALGISVSDVTAIPPSKVSDTFLEKAKHGAANSLEINGYKVIMQKLSDGVKSLVRVEAPKGTPAFATGLEYYAAKSSTSF
jgi:hypothetical protein